MDSWQRALSERIELLARERAGARLVVSIDADGTLLDPRPAIVDALHAADRAGGRGLYAEVGLAALAGRAPSDALAGALGTHAWDEARRILGALLEPEFSAAARARLLDVLRWLQMHPNTFVAFQSRRDASRSSATLSELRRIGAARGLRFGEDLLLLATNEGPKRSAVERLTARGMVVAAVVERDPLRLEAERRDAGVHGALCIDGRSLAEGVAAHHPGAVGGVPVQLNARGAWSRSTLAAFLASTAGWAEMSVECDARGDLFVAGAPEGAEPLSFEEALGMLAQGGKGLLLDLGASDTVTARVLLALARSGFHGDSVQLSAPMARFCEPLFRALLEDRAPGAALRAPIDPLSDDALRDPRGLVRRLQELAANGVRRFAVDWHGAGRDRLLEALGMLGLEAELRHPRGLDAFLAAIARGPAAVTCELPAVREPERVEGPAAPFALRSRSAMRA